MGGLKTFCAGLVLWVSATGAGSALAATAAEIDAKVDAALVTFNEKIKGGDSVLKAAKGYLVFPGVVKAGLGVGGEYGEGALRVGGKTVAYYSTASGSIGFQVGVQEKSEIIAFLDPEALKQFESSEGWKVGVDGSVALVTVGAGEAVDSSNLNKPIVGFIFGNKGLMYNLTLEGSKFSRIHPK